MDYPKNKHFGSSLDSFLQEEGILEHTQAVAIKRIIAYQITEALNKENMTQADLARKMKTSKAAIQRLLNAENPSITLQTLMKAAHALGKKVSFNLE